MKAKVLLLVLILLLSVNPVGQALLAEQEIKSSPQSECNADRNGSWSVGLIYCTDGVQEGYTLFSPMPSNTSYLIDQYGREVHNWTSPGGHRPGLSAYLLDDGSLLRTANLGQNQPGEFSGGGSAGKVERISWEGDLLWSWSYSSDMYRSHHDIEPLPNGNLLMIAWEYRNETEAAEFGKYPQDDSSRAVGTTSVWPDRIIEVEPVGNADANIVWQWSFWDHMIQDYDPNKANYGIVADHPELLDINFIDAIGAASGGRDWLHCNGIDYNPILDQIALSCKNTNEVYIIDHSTTTEEAASHSGGNSGMGGDILYRYGNPESYDRGDENDQVLFAQHDVQWIENGYIDEGKLMIFNNGNGRETPYSSVEVIETPIDGYRYLINDNTSFGPDELSWSWNIGTEMYSSAISGSTRLANGNTLVTFGMQGTFIEVDYTGKIVWKYISPINRLGVMEQGDSIFEGNGNKVFKVSRHSALEPAFDGRDLYPRGYIEIWIDQCPQENSIPYDVDGDGCIDDSDYDGVADPDDKCQGFDDSKDEDIDGIPDSCDDLIDNDNDGVANLNDLCEGFDDYVDIDNDTIPDGCDDLIDSDSDGISDDIDLCSGFDDTLDEDNDRIPDGCDELIDSDGDGIGNSQDICPNSQISSDNPPNNLGCTLSQTDSDMDGISDYEDKCEGYNDSVDENSNLIPDGCESFDDKRDDSNITETASKGTQSVYYVSLGVIIALFGLLIVRRSR